MTIKEITTQDELVSYLQAKVEPDTYAVFKKEARESALQVTSISGKNTLLHYDRDGRPMTDDLRLLISRTAPGLNIVDVSRIERLKGLQQSGGQFDFSAQPDEHTISRAIQQLKQYETAHQTVHAVKERSSVLSRLFSKDQKRATELPAGEEASQKKRRFF